MCKGPSINRLILSAKTECLSIVQKKRGTEKFLFRRGKVCSEGCIDASKRNRSAKEWFFSNGGDRKHAPGPGKPHDARLPLPKIPGVFAALHSLANSHLFTGDHHRPGFAFRSLTLLFCSTGLCWASVEVGWPYTWARRVQRGGRVTLALNSASPV